MSITENNEVPANQTATADSTKSEDTNKKDVPASEVAEDSNSESPDESELKKSE